jgi:alkyl hydroperoxide reductase subunit AhpF
MLFPFSFSNSIALLSIIFCASVFAAPISYKKVNTSKADDFFKTDYDVLIIGSGPSGLQAAMSIGRLSRTAMVFDSYEYRNSVTEYMHDVAALDGTPPATFRGTAKIEIANYPTISFKNTTITSIENQNNGTR